MQQAEMQPAELHGALRDNNKKIVAWDGHRLTFWRNTEAFRPVMLRSVSSSMYIEIENNSTGLSVEYLLINVYNVWQLKSTIRLLPRTTIDYS